MTDDKDDAGLKGDDKIIAEARRRFKRCEDWESGAQTRYIEDIKFAEGDSDNKWQWDDAAYDVRVKAQKPALTVNKTRQGNLQILNDQRQNKSQIKIRPVGDGATYDAAKVFEGIVRHIEYQSRALEAYDSAYYGAVYGGWGYLRIATDYVDDKSFDQEIYIRRERDALSIYLDPDAQEYDKSDARFGFKFRDRARDEAEGLYPWLKDNGPETNGIDHDRNWNDKDHVRECEYYRLVEEKGELLHIRIPPGVFDDVGFEGIVPSSDLPPGWKDEIHKDFIVNRRKTKTPVIEWFKIIGDRIVERNIWPGIYIPLIIVVGEETVIDGKLDRKGHTRSQKDPQRMYNWYSSAAVEYAAGQTKTPYLISQRAIEGLEGYWNNANNDTLPYLPWNDVDTDNPAAAISPPVKIAPPVSHGAAIEGMKIAQMELMMATGQYQAQFGENENAKSGVAIQTRQRQGDNATYHFIDHLAQALTFTGRQLIDLIPKIYDTPRVIKIMAEDGSQTEVNIDPNGPAYEQRINGKPASPEEVKAAEADPTLRDKIETIFNPNVGKYDVEADIGPAYNTRRQEAFAAMSELAGRPGSNLMQIAGDLYFKNADFPMADEIAERFKRATPKAILGEAPPPEVQQLQQQNEALHKITAELALKLSVAEGKVKQGVDKSHVDEYNAETQRMSAVGAIDPDAMKPIIRQLVQDALQTELSPLMDRHAVEDQARMPAPEPEAVN